MTTIKELKEWLNRFPDDTIVEFAVQESGRNYESYGAVNYINPVLTNSDCGDGWDYLDFTDNPHVGPERECYNKKYLRFGEGR